MTEQSIKFKKVFYYLYSEVVFKLILTTRIDLKDYLKYSSSRVLNLLKLSSRVFVLPAIVICPTSMCNFRCVMCSIHKEKKQILDFEVIKKIILDVCRFKLLRPRIHLSGFGDPLVYSDIVKVMELCRRKNIRWSITTNGYLLEEYAQELIHNQCTNINLSVHGTPKTHNEIVCVKDAYSKMIKGLDKLQLLKQTYNSSKPRVSINCVITSYNINELKEISSNFSKLPVNSITFQHLDFSREDIKNKASILIDTPDKVKKVIDFIRYARKTEFPMRINFFPKIKISNLYKYYLDISWPKKLRCVFPWLVAKVYPDAQVGLYKQMYGSLKMHNLWQIINGERARRLRSGLKKNKFRIPHCDRCCHRIYY